MPPRILSVCVVHDLSKVMHVVITNLCFLSQDPHVEPQSGMVCHNMRLGILPYNKHWRNLHPRQKLCHLIRPTTSNMLSVTKGSNGIKFRFLSRVVTNNFFELNLPFSLIKRPEALTEPNQDRLDKWLVRMIVQHSLQFVNIKGSLHFYMISVYVECSLNTRVIKEVFRRVR